MASMKCLALLSDSRTSQLSHSDIESVQRPHFSCMWSVKCNHLITLVCGGGASTIVSLVAEKGPKALCYVRFPSFTDPL